MGICGSVGSTVEKTGYLQSTPFFAHLDIKTLQELANYCEIIQLQIGEILREEAFVVVCEGELSISTIGEKEARKSRKTKVNVQEHLCRKPQGSFFSKANSSWQGKHKVTDMIGSIVKAIEPTKVLVLHQRRLKDFIESFPEMASPVRNALQVDVTQELSKLPFSESISARELDMLAEICAFHTEPPGTQIFAEGNDGSGGFYLILEGSVQVFADARERSHSVMKIDDHGVIGMKGLPKDAGKNVLKVSDLGPGESFGEMALLVDMPRSATVVTGAERVSMLVIAPEPFRNFMRICPKMQEQLSRHCKESMIDTLNKFQIPFFMKMEHDRWILLAHLCKLVHYPAETFIVKEGQAGESFHIIISGKVSCSKDGIGEVAELRAGDYFGEIAIVSKKGAQATVRASTPIVVLQMSKTDFLSFFAATPDDLIDFELKVMGPHADVEHILRHPLGRKVFKAHMEKECSVENVDFWEQVQLYKKKWSKEPESNIQRAKELFTTYIEGHDLNIHSANRQAVKEAVTAENIEITTFDGAQKEVCMMINHDSFHRFKRTPAWPALLKDVGCYSNIDDHQMLSARKRNSILLKGNMVDLEALIASKNISNKLDAVAEGDITDDDDDLDLDDDMPTSEDTDAGDNGTGDDMAGDDPVASSKE